jgi:NAD(P)H-hydrate epimerase
MRLVTRDEMRELDRATIEDHGTPGLVLMERAGQGVVRAIRERWLDLSGLRCLVVAGRGNNGGDGYVVARGLKAHGAAVTVFSTARPAELSGDAHTNRERFEAMGSRARSLERETDWMRLGAATGEADVIVDALLGTGFRGAVTGVIARAIEIVNAAGGEVVAVDIPSGLDADTGAANGPCVEADLTVTFGCAKVGCFVDPGRGFTGELQVVDIGIAAAALARLTPTYCLMDGADAAALVPARRRADHKGRFGRLLVIGGSAGLTGAVALAGEGALRAGGGLVTVAVPESLQDILAAKLTEVMTLALPETGRRTISVRAVDAILAAAERADAVAIGPGISRELETAELVRYLVRELARPLVLDADGLNAFSGRLDDLAATTTPLILTPHVVEMARITGIDPQSVETDRLHLPGRIARERGLVVLLKGSPSVVGAPDRPTVLSDRGNPGMATAGSGDVLTGVVLGLLGQGLAPDTAAALGMFVHGRAGDRAALRLGEHGLLAGDILSEVPAALGELVSGRAGRGLTTGAPGPHI